MTVARNGTQEFEDGTIPPTSLLDFDKLFDLHGSCYLCTIVGHRYSYNKLVVEITGYF